MPLPFFMNTDSTSYVSHATYDMVNASPMNSMNLFMNSCLEDSIAQRTLYNVPIANSGIFSQYAGVPGSNSYLLNPYYTVGQMTWGTPMWNNSLWNLGGLSGGFSLDFTRTGMGGGVSDSDSSSSLSSGNGLSDVEKTQYDKKYKKLKDFVTKLSKSDVLSDDKKSILEAALKNTRGNIKEKYENLKSAYDQVAKTQGAIEKFLIKNGKDVAVKSNAGLSAAAKKENTFEKRLLDAGYEFKNTDVDKELDQCFKEIKEFTDSDAVSEKANSVVDDIATGKFEILDLISSWNSKYKNEEIESSRRIVSHILNYYDKAEQDTTKDTIKDQLIRPLTTQLIDKANEVKDCLDEKSQKLVNAKIKALEEHLGASEISSDLSTTFDELYLLTREATMLKLRNDVIAHYGDIDSAVFNDKLFDSGYKKDLKEEGFESISSRLKLNDDELTRRPVVEDNANANANAASDPDAKKDVTEIESDIEEEEKVIKKQEEMKVFGLGLAEDLSGYTEDYYHINEKLKEINKDNVMSFLEGYYEENLGATEGLIEKLDDEHDGGDIKMCNKKKIIKSLLDVAEEKGLKSHPSYIAIKKIFDRYGENRKYAGQGTFNNGGWARLWKGVSDPDSKENSFWGWAKTILRDPIRVILDKVTDNEIIDKHMEVLYKEIKAKK